VSLGKPLNGIASTFVEWLVIIQILAQPSIFVIRANQNKSQTTSIKVMTISLKKNYLKE